MTDVWIGDSGKKWREVVLRNYHHHQWLYRPYTLAASHRTFHNQFRHWWVSYGRAIDPAPWSVPTQDNTTKVPTIPGVIDQRSSPRGSRAVCGSRSHYIRPIVFYYYSSLHALYVDNRFAAPKNFVGFIFGSLLIYSEVPLWWVFSLRLQPLYGR
jgi:hypothetical protein